MIARTVLIGAFAASNGRNAARSAASMQMPDWTPWVFDAL
jgi:hypothetical protein